MTELREETIRSCPHCGTACAVGPGARECPCCGQGYGAQSAVDHLPLPDDDARFAPAAFGAAAAVALVVVVAAVVSVWALIVVAIAAALAGAVFVAARRGAGAG
jgi:hypothetical protein